MANTHCLRCGKYLGIDIGYPYHEEENGDCYCGECAFIKGFVCEDEYIRDFAFYLHNIRAEVINDTVVISHGKKLASERKKLDRATMSYKIWRKEVFERDGYICRRCGKKTNRPVAHHLKSFNTHIELRTDVDNGLTLCNSCHSIIHRTNDKEYIKG